MFQSNQPVQYHFFITTVPFVWLVGDFTIQFGYSWRLLLLLNSWKSFILRQYVLQKLPFSPCCRTKKILPVPSQFTSLLFILSSNFFGPYLNWKVLRGKKSHHIPFINPITDGSSPFKNNYKFFLYFTSFFLLCVVFAICTHICIYVCIYSLEFNFTMFHL